MSGSASPMFVWSQRATLMFFVTISCRETETTTKREQIQQSGINLRIIIEIERRKSTSRSELVGGSNPATATAEIRGSPAAFFPLHWVRCTVEVSNYNSRVRLLRLCCGRSIELCDVRLMFLSKSPLIAGSRIDTGISHQRFLQHAIL